MEELKKYTLAELTTDGKGAYGIGAPAVDFDSQKYTYLRITDIKDDGGIYYVGLKSVEDKDAYKYLLKENDIVFARTGNSTGRTYFYEISDGELVYAGFLIKFNLDPTKVNPRILKYYTHSKKYYDWVKSFDTGGTRGNINAQTYANMPIELPHREYQDKIVNILSSLDNKIALNRRINDN
ncbi:restriction endonuclease S subunit [Parabacteroides sp. PFB2-10]|uniref:restriction endonuclease subunit S n=1 Tax=Parabacteroides sp. PFB2-10 TaxID=1742405 RepID=UPI00247379FD|nr:restriction endonuclease subunit S [Parabacteroides sp. PFB2-10]MDH6312672.1 restriction endonuclease S subunit [Parabacteroides sp. PFB2-10]